MSKCRSCWMYGHWASEHSADWSLPLTVKSTCDTPEEDAGSDVGSNNTVLKFNVAKLTDSQIDDQWTLTTITDLNLGALFDDGAIYAAFEIKEPQSIAPTFLQNWSGNLDSIPKNSDRFAHWQYKYGQHSSSKQRYFFQLFILYFSTVEFHDDSSCYTWRLIAVDFGRKRSKKAYNLYKDPIN